MYSWIEFGRCLLKQWTGFESGITMTTLFTFEDAQRHKEKGDCWLIIDGKVIVTCVFSLDVWFIGVVGSWS